MNAFKPAYGICVLALALLTPPPRAHAQILGQPVSAESVVVDATNVLSQSMNMAGNGIPRALLADAHAIAIVPGMVRGAFVVGLQHGRGVLLLRDAQSGWQPPRMIEITGGSVGYQIGVQSTDLILVFRTQQSVKNLLNRTLKIGVDASAAAGPVGRAASAATDLPLKSEILSYSRARGAFVGVSIDGSSISLDPAAEAGYYTQPGTIPASAAQLMQVVAAYSSGEPSAAAPPQQAGASPTLAAPPQPSSDLEAARQQLDAASRQLMTILDDNWKRYLALPADVYVPNQSPNPQWIQQAIARYEDVARRPEYGALLTRPEFQDTRRWLHRLSELQQANTQPLQLPPPPAGSASR